MSKETKKQIGIRLNQRDIDYLTECKEKNNLSSATQALELIIREHRAQQLNQNETIANLVIEKFDSKYGNALTRIRMASNTADKNIQIIMEILNSIFYNNPNDIKFVPTDIITSQLIKDATERVGKRIAYYKQLKNNKSNKG